MKLAGRIIIAGGTLLSLASFMHYFSGYPGITAMLKQDNAGNLLTNTVQIIWIFSSITMFLSGTWGIFIGKAVASGNRSSSPQSLFLGTGIIAFGIIGFYFPFPNYHLLGFALPGSLILLPGIYVLVKGK